MYIMYIFMFLFFRCDHYLYSLPCRFVSLSGIIFGIYKTNEI